MVAKEQKARSKKQETGSKEHIIEYAFCGRQFYVSPCNFCFFRSSLTFISYDRKQKIFKKNKQ